MRALAADPLAALPVALLPVLLVACQIVRPPQIETPSAVRYEPASAKLALAQIADEDCLAAWPAWLVSCQALISNHNLHSYAWQAVCDDARTLAPQRGEDVRSFFAQHMDLYRVIALTSVDAADAPTETDTGTMTGYYEPVLEGSREQTPMYAVPVYRLPAPIPSDARGQLRDSAALRGYELVWLHDAIDAFFLEIQGSGRILLPDGSSMRLAYAGSNGQSYRSIGHWLIEQGELPAGQASAPEIRAWAQAHPQRLRELLDQNPRMVFFRELPHADDASGPVGSQGVPLTAGVSVAVDPRYLPLGAPLLADTRAPLTGASLHRIVIAQDTGAAIRGPLRLDWFWGQGPQAEQLAGHQNAPGSVRVLVPRGAAPQSLL